MKRKFAALLLIVSWFFICGLSCWKPADLGKGGTITPGMIPDYLAARAYYFGWRNYLGGYTGDYFTFRFEPFFDYSKVPDSANIRRGRVNIEAQKFFDSVLYDQKDNYELLTYAKLQFRIVYWDSATDNYIDDEVYNYDLRNYPFKK